MHRPCKGWRLRFRFLAIGPALLASGVAGAAIDGGYVGTDVCLSCHDGGAASDVTSFYETGHPYKYRSTFGADCAAGDCDVISNILPLPASSAISTMTNDGLIIDDGFGNLDWSAVEYVVGGYGWKARYGMLDGLDLDGDGIDDTGYVWSGSAVQYNPLAADPTLDPLDLRPDWSGYHGGEDKAFNCGVCHNTNGATYSQGDPKTRTEPWSTSAGAGFSSEWTFDGVQCEACHGPGEDHVSAGGGTGTYPVPTDANGIAGNCSGCHQRNGADTHGADTSSGYIRHHEQFNEMVGNALEPGVHRSLDCAECHDPHLRSHTLAPAVATALGISDNDLSAEARGAVTSCESCHEDKTTGIHADLLCIDCHMSAASKSATAEAAAYAKTGDVKTHIFAINPDYTAEDTAASPNSVTGTNVAHNYLTLNYVCGKCHDETVSTYVGVDLDMSDLGNYAAGTHVPPVKQRLGVKDTVLNDLVEDDCRGCHEDPSVVGDTSNVDRHHLRVGTSVPEGYCSTDETVACQFDSDCPTVTGNDYCIGESEAPNVSAVPSGEYECTTCHTLVFNPDTGSYDFEPFRDCLLCHYSEMQPAYPDRAQEPNQHHRTPYARSADCQHCHGSLVDNKDDGHYIPTYDPSLVTPNRHGGDGEPYNSRGNGAGACNYCHDSSYADGSGPLFDNHDTHHGTGLTTLGVCAWCHYDYPNTFPSTLGDFDMRACENCHGIASLHNVQADSNGDAMIDPGNEVPFSGHIGSSQDCWGCHGFDQAASSTPYGDTVVPYLVSSDVYSVEKGESVDITLQGAALVNRVEAEDGSSVLESVGALTAPDGSVTTLETLSISEDTLVVRLPDTLDPGMHYLRAAKSDKVSNPIAIAVRPKVAVSSASCKRGALSIEGTGLGSYVNSSDSGTFVKAVIGKGRRNQSGVTIDCTIESWSDTQIEASCAACCGEIQVGSVWGADSTRAQCGPFGRESARR